MDPSATPPKTLSTPLRLGALQLRHRVFFASPLPLLGHGPGAAEAAVQAARDLTRDLQGQLVLCTLSPTQALWHTGAMDLGLRSAHEVNGWRAVTEAIHAGGGLAVARLGNVLACTEAFPNADELDEALDGYRTAAENAGDAGFDGVELIATDGSLPARLLHAASEMATQMGARVDKPLSLDFLAGVFQALLGAWAADRVGLSLTLPRSADQLDIESRALLAIETFDLAFLHLTSMTLAQGHAIGPIASRLRPLCRGRMLVSGKWTRALAEAAVRGGHVDAVGIASAFSWPVPLAEHPLAAGMVGR